jgi:hypothetical protein
MRQTIKRFLWVVGLVFSLQSAWAFSLLGPEGNGDDAWQVTVNGYNPLTLGGIGGAPPFFLDSLLTGPKNLGEEYRRNTPVLYYAANANFLDYFGSNGVVAIDQAFAILNALTNVDLYSTGLTEFSLNSDEVNYQAEALYLYDLKSFTLSVMVEQLGLADAVRYDWALHDRHTPPGATCPVQIYTVIQRNFDVTTTPLNQIQYSPYINGELYSYYIYENCGAPGASPPDADALEVATDPLFNNPPVAGGGNGEDPLYYGEFFTGLTRDDVAGLRYLLSTNNLNTESPTAGSLLWVTNVSAPQLITTTNLGLFILQAQTIDPDTLAALYPGLYITATVTNYAFAVVTNLTPYYTNQPGPASTNEGPLILWTNYDLALFSALIQTDSPPVLQALYPNLWIVSSLVVGYTNIVTTNYVTYLTNQIGAPAGSPLVVVTVPILPPAVTFLPLYSYTFGNIVTNTYSTRSTVTNQTITVTNVIGAPAGSPASTNITMTRVTLTNTVSGDFFIVPTNWCGYSILATQWVQVIPSFTNTLVAAGTTNNFGSAQFAQNTIFYYTNRIYAVFPGICEPVLVFATNVLGSNIITYAESFANVVTNSYFTNSVITILTTNIYLPPGGPTNLLVTNITEVTFVTNLPSGDFWIEPTNWNCGYTIVSVPFTNTVGTTNTIVTATIPPGVANIGQQYSVTTISIYTNHSLLIDPLICSTQPTVPRLYQGIGRIQFVRANYDSLLSQFFQPITNIYSMIVVTNNQPSVQFFQRVVTTPDFLFTAADLANGPDSDFGNAPYARNINFNTANVYPGLAGPGTIDPSTTVTFNKVGPVYANYGPIYLTGPNDPTNPYRLDAPYFLWGSFDGSTNDPVVYPNGTSIANLAAEVLIQIYPATLPNGTNGVAYPTVTLSATGGQTPYVWSLASGSTMPPGLNLSSGGVISGLPTQSGQYVVTIQMTDAVNRTVAVNYSITIN